MTHDPRLRTITEATLHRILAHASNEVLEQVHEPDHGVNLNKLEPTPSTEKCTSCPLAKTKKIISRQPGSEIPRNGLPFDAIFRDAIALEEAFNGDRYISHFYCPETHFNIIFTCKSKTEFKLTVRIAIRLIKKQLKCEVRAFRSDGETSLIQECKNFVNKQGIICQVSASNTPEQNGAAERSSGVIVAKARALGLEAFLPTNYWPETIAYAGYIAN